MWLRASSSSTTTTTTPISDGLGAGRGGVTTDGKYLYVYRPQTSMLEKWGTGMLRIEKKHKREEREQGRERTYLTNWYTGISSVRGHLACQVHVTFATPLNVHNENSSNNNNPTSSSDNSSNNNDNITNPSNIGSTDSNKSGSNSSNSALPRHCYIMCVKGTIYLFSHENLQNKILFRTFSTDTLEVRMAPHTHSYKSITAIHC